MFFPILTWTVWLVERDRMVWPRAALVAVLAWGLSAFWLTPSYLRVTLENMRWVSSPGHVWSAVLLLVVTAAYLWLSWRLVRGRPERAWSCFVLGSLTLFGLNVAGNQYIDFRVIGEPGRLIPELELIILMALSVLFAWIFRRGGWARAVAIMLAVACIVPGIPYLRHAWRVLPPRADHRGRIEFQLTNWIAQNLPGVRALATGSMRFWYNAWHDLPQLGGGSEQGLLNRLVQDAYVSAVADDDPPAQAIVWMKAMGTGAMIVHDKTSQEIYHDYASPRKFEGLLEKSYDDGAGNRIYRVPLRYPEPVRVVDAAALRAIGAIDGYSLGRYADVVERGPDAPPSFEALGTDAMRVRVRVAAGQLVIVQQSYDPAWTCRAGARRITIAKDPMGFLVLDPGPGDHDLLLQFETPLENRIGAAAGLAAAVVILGMMWWSLRRADAG
jgi:hypothetical protein